MATARIPIQLGHHLPTDDRPVSSAQLVGSDEFTLPIYQGIGAWQPVPHSVAINDEEPEDALLRLLRIHSDARIAFISCAVTWLANGCTALLILAQVDYRIEWRWNAVFSPLWLCDLVRVALQLHMLRSTAALVQAQVGADPGAVPEPSRQSQWTALYRRRYRSQRVDTFAGILEILSLLLCKVVMCAQIQQAWNSPWSVWTGQQLEMSAMHLIAGTLWATWAGLNLLELMKDTRERSWLTTRDLWLAFLLLATAKVAGWTEMAWKIIFLLPWAWFCCVFVLSVSVFLKLLAAVWRRTLSPMLICSASLVCIMCSAGLQVMAYARLTDLLDGGAIFDNADILLPAARSWFYLSGCSFILAVGLHYKSQALAAFLAAGGLWRSTSLDRENQRAHREGVLEAQRRIDAMSEEELTALVLQMNEGKVLPSQLIRSSHNLYRTLPSVPPAPLELGEALGGDAAVALQFPVPGLLQSLDRSVQARLQYLLSGRWLERTARMPFPLGPLPDLELQGGSSSRRQTQQSPAPRVRFSSTGHLDDQGEGLSSRHVSVIDGDQAPVWHQDSECDSLLVSGDSSQSAVSPVESALAETTPLLSDQVMNLATPQWPPEEGFPPWSTQTFVASDLPPQCPRPRRTTSEAEDALCIICYDQLACMVLLSCGHGGTCKRCSQLLFARPPHACAVCRQPITAIVQLEKRPRVGEMVNILKSLKPEITTSIPV